MYTEDELLPISALQHLLYCERQCALIHLEQAWSENRFTAEGRLLHQRADAGGGETRGDLRITRSLALRSLCLGLSGRADVVELHRVGDDPAAAGPGAAIPGLAGFWRPVPVEYKRGRPKHGRYDEVQLCAQALCLEEMLTVPIPEGALFYGQPRRRTRVVFDARLRALTTAAALRLHQLLGGSRVPPPVYGPKCKQCSLEPSCLPKAPRRSARSYLAELVSELPEGPT
ncbi:MAG: CRISPR-associated protein Cas4 [Acidobacteria bacterium]|nr:CRISPR-associated protein Cas4 [Acidobacteriota bacterium]